MLDAFFSGTCTSGVFRFRLQGYISVRELTGTTGLSMTVSKAILFKVPSARHMPRKPSVAATGAKSDELGVVSELCRATNSTSSWFSVSLCLSRKRIGSGIGLI
jgi:hypothetical protein